MKWILIALLTLIQFISKAQPQAYFDYKVFYTPSNEAYIEGYFSFIGESLALNKNLKAEIVLTVIVKQDTSILNYSKTAVTSPVALDSLLDDFINIQRFALKPGNYNLEIELIDKNKTALNTTTFKQKISVESPPTLAHISDVIFVAKSAEASVQGPFTKSGIDIIPYVNDYFFPEINLLSYYAELYNTQKQFPDSGSVFVSSAKILNPTTGELFRDYVQYKRHNSANLIPLLGAFEIDGLPSGKYNLSIEIRNAKNELVVGKILAFQRNNPAVKMSLEEVNETLLENSFLKDVSLDTLTEYIYCLRPIAGDEEKKVIDQQKTNLASLADKKRFFYAFWANRNATDPSNAWYKYRLNVNLVNDLFKTQIREGYETDRGRVYLQYGPPNTRTERPNETANYPYEIWHYYRIDKYNNRRFVFYNTDLITNDFDLLHSDMFGEPKNNNWRVMLARRTNSTNNPDKRNPDGQYGNSSDDFFTNPR